MDELHDDGPRRVATNLRLLLLVEALAKARQPLSQTQMNEHLRLPKQTVHRLCGTLVQAGFLERVDRPCRLRPTARLRSMAGGLLAAAEVEIGIRQVLERVAAAVREAVNFVVPERSGMTYLDRVDTDWAFRVQLPIGSHVPFHCTASGKIYLASLPARRRRLVGALNLERKARNTIVTPEALSEELETVAERGYAIDNEEFMEGLVALAVPVLDAQGDFLAVLAYHGPVQRLDRDKLLAHLELLRDGAGRLSALLVE